MKARDHQISIKGLLNSHQQRIEELNRKHEQELAGTIHYYTGQVEELTNIIDRYTQSLDDQDHQIAALMQALTDHQIDPTPYLDRSRNP